MFNNKNILITGGTGSFGQHFAFTLVNNYNPKKVIIYSRDELKQYEMQKKIDFKTLNKFRFFIGDVRDLSRLRLAFDDIDIVVHAAALKQVPVTEYNPIEAIKTNILGAQNIIEASLYSNIKKVLALSTDKAAAPVNLYGATKLVSDKLFISANNLRGKRNIKFSLVRYGNVMFSRGSVIPLFLEQTKNNLFTLTHKDMTRFNITLDQGVNFVINSIKNMKGGEIFIPKLYSYKVRDLASAINKNAKIKFIGLRPGEKIHEELIAESDSFNAVEYKNQYVIHSKLNNNKLKSNFKSFSYNSKNNKSFLTINDLKLLIKQQLKITA